MKKLLILGGLMMVVSALSAGQAAVDQLGYKTGEKKYVISTVKDGEFKVKRVPDDKTVYEGEFKGPVNDEDSGDACYIGDFSGLKEKGEYYIETTKGSRSYKFMIKDEIYNFAFYKTMRGFYLQRCGTAVSDPGGFSHEKCHTQAAKFHPSSESEGELYIPKGWHDAGDYGRYVVNSGIATGTLLLMYERYEKSMKNFNLDIPESGNSVPDVLDEIKWNLEFMLAMQKYDGGVYSKVTTKRFPSMEKAAKDDKDTLYIYEITTPATADFAAVMAIAARVYEPFDSGFAAKCLKASERSWDYLARIRKTMFPAAGFKNPPDTQTGQYGDTEDSDERLWAAVELYTTTGKDEYHKYFLENYDREEPLISSAAWWQDVRPMAMLSYAYSKRQEKNDSVAEEIVKDLKSHADDLLIRAQKNGYKYVLERENYVWGSNSVALNYAINLISAYELLKARPKFKMKEEELSEYKQAALDTLHYMFGRNPFNVSYVTGVGENFVRNIHHRPTAASGSKEPFPGLLAGGPNLGKRDDELKKLPGDTPPAKCYIDTLYSYASNEIAINWNAPLAYVLAFFTEDIVQVPGISIEY